MQSQQAWIVRGASVALSLVPALWIALAAPSFGPESFRSNVQDPLLFRSAAELVLAGRSPYDPAQLRSFVEHSFLGGQTAPELIPFAYPPTALPFLLVHAVGSPRAGYVCAVLLFAAAFACALLYSAERLGASTLQAAVLALAAAGSGAACLNALLGQTGTLLGALVLAYVALLPHAPRAAGVALGLLAFKPQYAPLLWLLAACERRLRVLASATATLAVLAATVTSWLGAACWSEWQKAALRPNPTLPFMGNWAAALARAGVPLPPLQAAGPWVLLAALLLMAALTLRTRAVDPDSVAGRARLAFALSLATFASPNTHPYDLVLWFAVPLLLPVRRWLWALGLATATWAALSFGLRGLLPGFAAALGLAALSVMQREQRCETSGRHAAPRRER